MIDTNKRLVLLLFAVGAVDSQSPASNLVAVQISGGVLGRLLVLVFAEAESLGPAGLTVIYNPLEVEEKR